MIPDSWRSRARSLEREAYALYFACRDPRAPLYARIFALCLVGYMLSPVDPIPDFIPILGLLDEMVVIPAGVLLLRRMVPAALLAEHRERSEAMLTGDRRVLRAARAIAGAIVVFWLLLAALTAFLGLRIAR